MFVYICLQNYEAKHKSELMLRKLYIYIKYIEIILYTFYFYANTI